MGSPIYTDTQDRTWSFTLTTPILIQVCRRSGLDLATVMSRKVNIGDLIDSLWVLCREQAKERKITEKEFFETVATPDQIPMILNAVWDAVIQAFPALHLEETMSRPFAGLNSGT